MAEVKRRLTKAGEERWRVRYRVGGRDTAQRVKTFATEKQALRFEALLNVAGVQQAEAALAQPETATERTVAEQVRHHIEHLPRISGGTKSDYRDYLETDIEPTIGKLPLSLLTRDAVTEWVMAMATTRKTGKGPLAPKSIENRQGLLSAALKSAVRDDLLMRNVAEGVEIPKPDLEQTKEMTVLRVDELPWLMHCTPIFWRPLVATLVGTGIRISEACALQVQDIDPATRTARIERSWKHTDGNGHLLGLPKSSMSRRTIYLGSLVELLEPHLDRAPDEWLFVNSHGGVVRRNTFYSRHWTEIVHAFAGDTATKAAPRRIGQQLRRKTIWTPGAGKHPTIHDMRHTYASIKIAEGKSMAWLQKQLGHESIDTTIRTYTHLQTADLAQLGDVMDWTVHLIQPEASMRELAAVR